LIESCIVDKVELIFITLYIHKKENK
jgi:hypothetical protein